MSYAFRARKKALKRSKDAEDPERREVRNAIRNGRAPRLTMIQDRKILKTRIDKKAKVAITRGSLGKRIAFSFGIIMGRDKS